MHFATTSAQLTGGWASIDPPMQRVISRPPHPPFFPSSSCNQSFEQKEGKHTGAQQESQLSYEKARMELVEVPTVQRSPDQYPPQQFKQHPARGFSAEFGQELRMIPSLLKYSLLCLVLSAQLRPSLGRFQTTRMAPVSCVSALCHRCQG